MKVDLLKYRKYFSENRFWQKLSKISRGVGIKVVYSALLLYYAYRRRETPIWARSIILGALGYLLTPIDLIPDLTPIIGYTDDMSILALGMGGIAAFINEDVRVKARTKLYLWFKPSEVEQLEDPEEIVG